MTRLLVGVIVLTLSVASATHTRVVMTRITPPYTGYRCLQDGGTVRFVDFRKMCVTTYKIPRRK